MTTEQRKLSLINWITNLEDETVITQIEGLRKTSIKSLPKDIVELLDIAMNESDEDCIEHSSVEDLLNGEE